MKSIYLLLTLSYIVQLCHSYRILALIPFSGKSHYIMMQPIVKELAERGHEVTVLTTYKEANPPSGYKEIVADKRLFWEYMGQQPDIFALEKLGFRGITSLVWEATYFTTEVVLNSTSVKDFIKNDKSHFDLIFVEVFYQEALYMFANKYQAPIVGISTNGYNLYIGNFMGSPNILSYMTHEFIKTDKHLSFVGRLTNIMGYAYDTFWRKYYLLPKHQKLAERAFVPGPLPQLADIEKNISLVLLNSHFSYDRVRPLVPGIIEIGGAHIKKPKPLPQDIKKFLDSASDGAIYFSFGSNVRAKDMPQEKIDIFLSSFKKLKVKIIWKFEADLPNKPENVMTGQWLPQNDILAHPNMRLFITHGGLLSTQEAMYHGVPLLGFPFYGDQFPNLKNVQDLGFGASLYYSTLNEKIFTDTLKELLNNPKYINTAKELSRRFNDRPNSAMDTAIYWIEYVIKNKGAPHLKSPISNLSIVEYYMLDVLVFIHFVIFLSYFFIRKLMNCLTSLITKNSRKNIKKKKI